MAPKGTTPQQRLKDLRHGIFLERAYLDDVCFREGVHRADVREHLEKAAAHLRHTSKMLEEGVVNEANWVLIGESQCPPCKLHRDVQSPMEYNDGNWRCPKCGYTAMLCTMDPLARQRMEEVASRARQAHQRGERGEQR